MSSTFGIVPFQISNILFPSLSSNKLPRYIYGLPTSQSSAKATFKLIINNEWVFTFDVLEAYD